MRYVTLLLEAVVAAAAAPAAGHAAAAGDVPANVPRKGLVAFWTADGHARDSAGENHGTVGPGVAFTADRYGTAKGALLFNGKQGVVRVPDSDPLDTDDAFTLSAWINPRVYRTARRKYQWIVAKWYESPFNGDYEFYLSGEQLGLSVCQDHRRNLLDFIKSKRPVPLNAWTHVAGTFDRGRLRLYVNGGQVAEKVSAKVKHTDRTEYVHDEVTIGNWWRENTYLFDGAIDEVGIWSRALSADEVAALAGGIAGVTVVRAALHDRAHTVDDLVLKGTIRDQRFTITTAFGPIGMPARNVVGMVRAAGPLAASRPKDPPMLMILADGQVVKGRLPDQAIVVKTEADSTLTIPIHKLREFSYRVNEARPATAASAGPLVILRDGQRLRLAATEAPLQLAADWGEVLLASKVLLRVTAAGQDGARHRAYLAGGSTVTGTLAEKLALKLALGPRLSIARTQVWRITGTAEPASVPAATTVLLRNRDRLIGRLAVKSLTLQTEYGRMKIRAAGIESVTIDPNKAGEATVLCWNATRLKGKLVEATVAVEVLPGGPKVAVPIAMIASITQTSPSPPPEMLKKIAGLAAQLGAESYKDRQAAEEALVKMGGGIEGILKRYLKAESDPEIRLRLERIIKALGGKAGGRKPP